MPDPETVVRRTPFLSVPAWDVTEEEIAEWKETGKGFAAFTARRIMDGRYDSGEEIYPQGSVVYQEISRETVDRHMELLASRGMARKTEGKWYAIAPGRLEPSIRRAASVLLDRRDDLPAALAAELDSWKDTLDAVDARCKRGI